MTAELHFETDPRELLRTSMNWYFNAPPSGLPAAFLHAIDENADTVETLTKNAGDADDQAWYRAAIATKAILRDHSESVKNEWLEAYASLPPMKWPGSEH